MSQIKIMQLNAWCGRMKDALTSFILANQCDVVCMQEAVWSSDANDCAEYFVDTIDKIKRVTGYDYELRSSNFGIKMLDGSATIENGNVILSKIPFTNAESYDIYNKYGVATNASEFGTAVGNHLYTAQKIKLENGIVVANYHGYWLKDPLGDSTTVACMRKVADILKNENASVIMCGDLNVVPASPAMRELDFLTDLTAEHKLKTTLQNIRFQKNVPCDHILVSKDIQWQEFRAVANNCSDHMGLIVTVEV